MNELKILENSDIDCIENFERYFPHNNFESIIQKFDYVRK